MIRKGKTRCQAGIKHRRLLWRPRELRGDVLEVVLLDVKATLYYKKF